MSGATSGAELIARERARQIADEGYTSSHDDAVNGGGELSWAAAGYATFASAQVRGASPEEFRGVWVHEMGGWPGNWPADAWNPDGDPIRNLAKAGALIAAEIDRLLRKKSEAH